MTPSAALPQQWEADLTRLEVEWSSYADPPEVSAGVPSTWAAEIASMAADQQRLELAGAWLSGPRDLLSIVGLQRWERAHSAALRWLLDPAGGHGLGARLLDRLLGRLGLAPSDPSQPVRVTIEEDGGTALVDVLVRSESWTLVIEVKIDAVEQRQQAYRLWNDWHGHPMARFVYLTPSGRPTTTHESDECQAAWWTVRWRDVLEDLAEALGSVEGGPGRMAAEQYHRTLQALFGRPR